MAITPARVILFLIGLLLAGGVVAYGTGALAPLGGRITQSGTPDEIAALPKSTPATPDNAAAKPDNAAGNASTEAPEAPAQSKDGAAAPEPTSERPSAPSFDLLRVEADGSMVVAGEAAANAAVELVSGSTVIGKATANANGDFAIVLDETLEPGDYSLVLRSTAPGIVATSVETAIVSVPESPDGQVLAMVEQPGQPSRILTVPEAEGQAAANDASDAQPSVAAPQASGMASEAAPRQQAAAENATADPITPSAGAAGNAADTLSPQRQAAADPAAGQGASDANVSNGPAVEAVEIEGDRVFVAGRAAAGSRLRIYADDMLLGEVVASEGGRFLVETQMNLPVGSYTIRVDTLGPDGATVISRAAVPFEREPGESVAAVAPDAGGSNADQANANGASGASGSAATAASGNGADDAASSRAPASVAVDGAGDAQPDSDARQDRVAGASGEAGPMEASAPALERAQGAVIIRRGDTLWRISKRAYGQGVRYSTIYLANQDQIEDPDKIWPGQIFRMPESSLDGHAADMGRLGDQATTRTD